MNDEKNNKFDFINEKILNQKLSGQSPLRTVLFVIGCAILFGLISCLTFYWAKPYIEHFFNNRNGKNGEGAAAERNTDPEDEITTISVEEAVKKALAEYEINMEEYTITYEKLGAIGEQMDKSMATVVSGKSSEWFDEENERKTISSGIIISASETEGILILTDFESVEDCKSLLVYLNNGKGYRAEIYKSSRNVGVALLCIAGGVVDEVTFSELSVVDIHRFGDHKVFGGEKVVLMGNPYGLERFMAYGSLTSVGHIEDKTDIRYRLMTTNISNSGSMNGFVMDLEGNILGMIIRGIEPRNMKGIVSAVHLDELALYIEKLMNGNSISYLGINGEDVTDEVIENIDKEMPLGVYITGTVKDSPAYISGLMNGDILVEIEGGGVKNIKEYMKILQEHSPGDVISIEVMRKGKDGYKEIVYSVIVGNG
ncbi:MAG: serine protease [Lachnospiraceae bacterium]|nr:serine protease [Lachnospiraceae bacterium]